jgi:Flp pilus assembly pilin Flp
MSDMDFERVLDFVRFLYVRLQSQRGQTMAEYGILVAWLALVAIVGATKLGASVSHTFSSTAGKI